MNRPGPYDVTLIESDDSYASRLTDELEHAAMSFRVHRFIRFEQATDHLLNGATDVIVLDAQNEEGLSELASVLAKFPEMPVVAVADTLNGDFARDAVKHGALDCLVKADLAPGVLARVLVSAIERQFAQNLLTDLSLLDPLTGLFNRKGFFTLVDQRLRLGRRSGKPMKLVFVDIEGLQQINRVSGHAEGDRMLKMIASAMKSLLRGADTLARFGPQEFVAAVEDCGAVDARSQRERKKILLIDDDESILKMVSRRLESSGYDVLRAKDGREGLESARQGWPDLVILDLRLPGYSGEEVCKAIREDGDKEFARTPILMLTGKTADVDRVVGMVIGASAYLTKPFRTADLMRNVRKLAGQIPA